MAASEARASARVFHGTIINATDFGEIEILEDHMLGVTADGVIAFVEPAATARQAIETAGLVSAPVVHVPEGGFLLPGLIDTHIHAPQYVFTGTGMDLPLLDWLNKYTFPTESKFKDTDFARHVYDRVVSRTLSHGTTTACYFGTIHSPATKALADIAQRLGQRAFVGKVCMDQNAPDFYTEGPESLAATRAFVEEVQAMNDPLIVPILTPRFVPVCTMDLMKGLATLAKEKNIPIQSHLSENLGEIAWVKSMYPEAKNYADVYDMAGLLTPRTHMAHCIHLEPEEITTMAARGTGIAHCPNSNLTLCSGILDVRPLLAAGLKVGLGTDVAGGYSASMFDAVRTAVVASKAMRVPLPGVTRTPMPSTPPLTFKESFHLATVGGAKVMGLEGKVGRLRAGHEFDALVINPRAPTGPIDMFPGQTVLEAFEKFLFIGDDRNVVEVYVKGRQVMRK